MKAVMISSLIMGAGISVTNGVYLEKIVGKVNTVIHTATDMPQIPFEVEDGGYKKTVKVVAGCSQRPDSVTLKLNYGDANVAKTVYSAVDKAFNKPGITRIQICRVERLAEIN